MCMFTIPRVSLFYVASADDVDGDAVTERPEPVRQFKQIANDRMEDHGIPEAALHRLQMQNTMHNIKKVKILQAFTSKFVTFA